MSAQGFVNLFAVVVGFIAALFFCVGSALLTRKSIGGLLEPTGTPTLI
jgi:hypothetical protein